MSKSKRIRQANSRAAAVHRYTVQQGLATCRFGSCTDCRTPEQQLLHDVFAGDLTKEMHKLLDVIRRPVTALPQPPYRHRKPTRRRYLRRAAMPG